MNGLYENRKKSVWTRIEENSDIDELIYGSTPSHETETTEDSSER